MVGFGKKREEVALDVRGTCVSLKSVLLLLRYHSLLLIRCNLTVGFTYVRQLFVELPLNQSFVRRLVII